jgi:hypothetical protein
MSHPFEEFKRLWMELDGFQKQIVAGRLIHVPTFHRTIKALEASVLGVMTGRQEARRAKPSQQSRQCDGKQRFISRQSAKANADAHKDRDHLEPYSCVFCGFWHYGNTIPVSRLTSEARA